MNEYRGHERRKSRLSEGEHDKLVNATADKVLEKVYGEIGKGMVKRLAWVLGLTGTGIFVWLVKRGIIP